MIIIKKVILIIFAVILICIIVNSNKTENNDELRIRVIANSDNEEDQNIKYLVVSVLKNYITSNSSSDMKEMINCNINTIKSEIQYILDINNYDKEFSVAIKKTKFPPKQLNNSCISGGNYETLLVTIGEGKGKNWWSLLYPDYFNISFEDIESGEVEFKSYFYEKIKDIF